MPIAAQEFFIGVGKNGTIITSFTNDGATWVNQTSGVSVQLNSASNFSNGFYKQVVGDNGTWLASGHNDPTTWVSVGSLGTSASLRGCSYLFTPDTAVAVGVGGVIVTGTPSYATNVTLSSITLPSSGTSNNLNAVSIVVNLGLLVAVGDAGTILTSPDGLTWTARTSGTSHNLHSVVDVVGGLSGGTVQVEVVGDSGVHLTSTDAITWTLS